MERKVGESQEQYKARRAARDRDFNRRMQPRLIWDSHILGTYVRPPY